MKSVNFTDFRKNASELFSKVEMGETVEVTRHGKAIATIHPVGKSAPNEPSWKSPALRLVIPGGGISETLIEERKASR